MAARYDDPFSDLPGDTPVYRLLMACYMDDDTLHAEDEIIAFTGVPNEYMEPLNDPARKNMELYLSFLDKCGREAAEKAGRSYSGRITDLGDQIAQAMNDARTTEGQNQKLQVVMPEKRDVPLRPDLVPAAKRRGRPSKLLASKAPAPAGKPTPKPIAVMGKDYEQDAGSNSSLS